MQLTMGFIVYALPSFAPCRPRHAIQRVKRHAWRTMPIRATAPSDVALTTGALLAASGVVGVAGALRSRGKLDGRVARKTVHASCGVLYVLLWAGYSVDGRVAAAVVPVAALVALFGARGALTRVLSREGKEAGEALRGPTAYALVLLSLAICCWQSAEAHVVVAQLCVGDAAAEICGRRFGQGNAWPFAKSKSIAGSVAFAAAAAAATAAMLAWHARFAPALATTVDLNASGAVLRIAAVSIACAAAELAPSTVVGDDNISVAATAALMSRWLLH